RLDLDHGKGAGERCGIATTAPTRGHGGGKDARRDRLSSLIVESQATQLFPQGHWPSRRSRGVGSRICTAQPARVRGTGRVGKGGAPCAVDLALSRCRPGRYTRCRGAILDGFSSVKYRDSSPRESGEAGGAGRG